MTEKPPVNDAILEEIHQMRLKMFDNKNSKLDQIKPYFPLLSADEKNLIMEKYYAGKSKLLNK